eukprot:3013041-Rhodomonas_salina.1
MSVTVRKFCVVSAPSPDSDTRRLDVRCRNVVLTWWLCGVAGSLGLLVTSLMGWVGLVLPVCESPSGLDEAGGM